MCTCQSASSCMHLPQDELCNPACMQISQIQAFMPQHGLLQPLICLCATRTVGGVHTAHHSVALKVKSALDCLPDEDELMPEAAHEYQNSTLTQTTADSEVFETQSRPPPTKARCTLQYLVLNACEAC